MQPEDLAGIAIYSEDLNEIETAVSSCMATSEEFLFAQCALAFGQMAMRFGTIDKLLFHAFTEHSRRFAESRVVAGALHDMEEDIKHFKPSIVNG